MFWEYPFYSTLVIKLLMTVRNGKAASKTKEKLQPFEKLKAKPETVMEKAKMIVLIFSPSAF